jgi:hypothetical protein
MNIVIQVPPVFYSHYKGAFQTFVICETIDNVIHALFL